EDEGGAAVKADAAPAHAAQAVPRGARRLGGRAAGGDRAGRVMSASEMVDVVDADDRVIGQATRAEVRAQKLRHRATYILVFNSHGQLCVHQRTATKDIYPSYYDVAVGGVVGAGERYDDGAQRELAEELGIRGVAPRPILKFQYEDADNRVNGRVYSCSYDG